MKLTLTFSNARSRVKMNFAIALSVLRFLRRLPQAVFRAATLHELRALLAMPADPRQPQKWIATFRRARMQYRAAFRSAAGSISTGRPVFCCAASIPNAVERFLR